MPKIRTSKTKPPPEGWEELEPVLEDIQRKMREAENESHEGKRRNESLWPVIRLDHQRSRVIYEKFYKQKEISKELYDWLVKEGWANAALIAKWKKSGYDSLCCLQCILPRISLREACACAGCLAGIWRRAG